MSSLASTLKEPLSDDIEAPLRDGSVARIRDGVLELHDPKGRLLLRFEDGNAELAAPNGNLILAAPRGRVEVRSAQDVCISANRDIVHQAERRVRVQGGGSAELSIEPEAVRVKAPSMEAETGRSRLVSQSVELLARQVSTAAERIVTKTEHFEIETEQLVEKARDAFVDVQDLLQQRVGRVRAIVQDVWSMRSRRTVMESTEDTSIDGERILLG